MALTGGGHLENSTELPGDWGYLLGWRGIVPTVITARVGEVTHAPRQVILILHTIETDIKHLLHIDVTDLTALNTTNKVLSTNLSIPGLF